MSVLYLNSGTQDVLTKTSYLLQAAEEMGISNVRLWENVPDPEYVLNIQPYYLKFRTGTKWTGVWEIDCLINRRRIAKYWDRANTIFLANHTDLLTLPKHTEYLYQACEPNLYVDLEKPAYDFVHIGSITDNNYFLDFGRNGPSAITDIYGERRRLLGELAKKYSYAYLGKRLPIRDYIKKLALGRVQFIRSMDVLGEGEIAQRFFECLPIGPVLTNYAVDLDNLGLVEGEDYLSYIDDEEAFEKMELLLNDEALRLKIAANGRKKALTYHTYQNRLEQLLSYLREHHGFI